MHKHSAEDVTPIVSQHGEIVYELIGNAAGATQRHSVAYVVIPPGKASLLHYHPEAEESYYILKGYGRILLGDEQETIKTGESVLIPSPKPHKIINIGEENLEFIAVCVPAWEPANSVYLDDDII
jgi:mannose-6-phosphate isomerase-like protein (cupin superfamily)